MNKEIVFVNDNMFKLPLQKQRFVTDIKLELKTFQVLMSYCVQTSLQKRLKTTMKAMSAHLALMMSLEVS